MPEFNKSLFKRVFSRIRKERLENWRRGQLPRRVPADQRAFEKLLTSYLTKTGFPARELDKIRKHNETELLRLAKKQKTEAIRHSSSVKKTLRTGVENWRGTVGQLVSTQGGTSAPVGSAILPTPFLIWPTHGIYLDSTNIQPWNNRAKIKFDANDPNLQKEELGFYFFWENPSNHSILVDVQTSLVLNGFCQANEHSGISTFAWLDITTDLALFQWWNQPPDSPLDQQAQHQGVLSIGTFENYFGGTQTQAVNDDYDVRFSFFSIPPRGVVVYEVRLTIQAHSAGGGDVHADFLSGAYEVLCPAVVQLGYGG
jgi:hypothetical protein